MMILNGGKKNDFDAFASFYIFVFYLCVPLLFSRILLHSNFICVTFFPAGGLLS